MRYKVVFQETAEYEVEIDVPEDLRDPSDAQLFGLVDSQHPVWFSSPRCILDRQFLRVEPVEKPLFELLEKGEDE